MKVKLLFVLIFVVGFTFKGIGQELGNDKFSFGIEASRPDFTNPNYRESYIGIGGSIKYDKHIAGNFYLTGSAQYLYFPYNTNGQAFAKSLEYYRGLGAQDLTYSHKGDDFATLMIGAKYYFTKKFYGEGQVGIETTSGALYGDPGAFVFSPGFGYNLCGGIDVGLRYQGWLVSGILVDQLTIRAAYSLDIKWNKNPGNNRGY